MRFHARFQTAGEHEQKQNKTEKKTEHRVILKYLPVKWQSHQNYVSLTDTQKFDDDKNVGKGTIQGL